MVTNDIHNVCPIYVKVYTQSHSSLLLLHQTCLVEHRPGMAWGKTSALLLYWHSWCCTSYWNGCNIPLPTTWPMYTYGSIPNWHFDSWFLNSFSCVWRAAMWASFISNMSSLALWLASRVWIFLSTVSSWVCSELHLYWSEVSPLFLLAISESLTAMSFSWEKSRFDLVLNFTFLDLAVNFAFSIAILLIFCFNFCILGRSNFFYCTSFHHPQVGYITFLHWQLFPLTAIPCKVSW